MNPTNRRKFLLGAGGTALALPFMQSLAPRNARAEAVRPRRVIFEMKCNGDHVARRFNKKGADFELGEFLEPLNPYKNELLFLDSVNKHHNKITGDKHVQGGGSLAPWDYDFKNGTISAFGKKYSHRLGPSADFVIGERVQKADPSVQKRHLYFRNGDGESLWAAGSHGGPEGTPNALTAQRDPMKAYNELFEFTGDGSGEPGDNTQVQQAIEMRRSALDFVLAEAGALQPRLSVADRVKLDQHMTAMRDVELTLTAPTRGECAVDGLNVEGDGYLKDHRAFMKVSALALSCDLTRVVNYMWGKASNNRSYRNVGVNQGHHDLSHRSGEGDFANIRKIHRHLWEETVPLYEDLKATSDGEGTLWDNTLIVHWNELGQGNSHSFKDNLVVLGGGAQGHFKMGRQLDLNAGDVGEGFSNILISVFHYMGFEDVMGFGKQGLFKPGPLGKLTA